jgi:hypothetical protein
MSGLSDPPDPFPFSLSSPPLPLLPFPAGGAVMATGPFEGRLISMTGLLGLVNESLIELR